MSAPQSAPVNQKNTAIFMNILILHKLYAKKYVLVTKSYPKVKQGF